MIQVSRLDHTLTYLKTDHLIRPNKWDGDRLYTLNRFKQIVQWLSSTFTRVESTSLIYMFLSLFAVDTFRHFGPRILNMQIQSPFLTRNLSYLTNFEMWISEFADKKSANNEYHMEEWFRLNPNGHTGEKWSSVLSFTGIHWKGIEKNMFPSEFKYFRFFFETLF